MSSLDGPRARLAATFWGAVVFLTDCLPPRVRYGYVHRITRAALARPLPSLAATTRSSPVSENTAATARTVAPPPTTCILAADSLDIGGIGSVIEMLAVGLSAHGVRPVVLCPDDGARAERLRSAGVDVLLAADEQTALSAIESVDPDAIQLHSAPPHLERAALRSARPLVPVMHNTEIHYTRARWSAFSALMAESATGIAVSETVREFHLRRIGDATPIVVVPNGAPSVSLPQPDERAGARGGLSHALGTDVRDDIVFVCLARYDAQKNTAGLVSAFGTAIARSDAPLRLVWAGDPSDWAELRRADALRRSGPASDRIHLLGNSDAQELLTAADAFVLDSFFEGWPVAATEAAAFGLPLLLSDVGGARELVSRDPERSVLIPNATGDAGLVSDARVRSARRRSRRQSNTAALADAVDAIAAAVRSERYSPVGAPERSTIQTMLAQHADIIRQAADAKRSRSGS